MRTYNTKGLPDFREVPLDRFNEAIARYYDGTGIKDLSDGDLWILCTKWTEVDAQVDARTAHGMSLRAGAAEYRRSLETECRRRGILASKPSHGRRNARQKHDME